MKFFIALLSFLFFVSTNIKAQDTILKINSDTILAKISEITPTEIKFKKINLLDGPTYVEKKTDVKGINYSNGLKEIFSSVKTKNDSTKIIFNKKTELVNSGNKIETSRTGYKFDGRKIGEREMQGILLATKDKQISEMVQTAKDAKAMQNVGFAGIPLGIASIVFLFSSINFGGTLYGNTSFDSGKLTASGILLCGAIACPIASGVFKHKRTRLNKQAVQLYNEKH